MTTPTLTRNLVELTGDRQTGKTETLIRTAIADATASRRVLFGNYRWALARNTFERTIAQLPRDTVHKALRSNGNMRIEFTSGGLIQFFSITGTGQRGVDCDTLILDDAHEYEQHITSAIVCTNASTNPRDRKSVV